MSPFLGGASMLLVLAGCATTTPDSPALEAARQAYWRAESSPAARYAPDDLRRAELALERAESLSDQHPGSPEADTQTYIAARRAELASARGAAQLASVQRDRAVLASLQAQTQRLARVSAELQRANTQLAAAVAERAQEPAPAVRHEGGGDVITISGAVLFAHGSADIQPAARETLDRVAAVLRTVPDRRVVVEGFTDSTGNPAQNEQLSLARAKAVEQYLASKGVEPQRVATQGFGARNPVATNATPDGRAANRRVEIVVQPRAGAAEPMPPSDSGKPR
jgi:outer membrane protein OmpA-like peptidoglycan-associated protein